MPQHVPNLSLSREKFVEFTGLVQRMMIDILIHRGEKDDLWGTNEEGAQFAQRYEHKTYKCQMPRTAPYRSHWAEADNAGHPLMGWRCRDCNRTAIAYYNIGRYPCIDNETALLRGRAKGAKKKRYNMMTTLNGTFVKEKVFGGHLLTWNGNKDSPIVCTKCDYQMTWGTYANSLKARNIPQSGWKWKAVWAKCKDYPPGVDIVEHQKRKLDQYIERHGKFIEEPE